jgi:2-iminobutanoate/2-iminopropanoate deaminase
MKRAVKTDAAPAAIGPYSQAVRNDRTVFCSGQIGLDPTTGALVGGGVVPECRQVMRNLTAVLAAEGLGWADVVKTTIYLVDIADFTVVNDVYAEFVSAPHPARATVAVAALPKGARVEIEATAIGN